MPAVIVRRGPLSDDERGELIFDGHLVVFSAVEGLEEFRSRIATVIHERLGDDPCTAHRTWAPDRLRAAIKDMRDQVRGDHRARELFATALASVGGDLNDSYADRMYLRALPPGPEYARSGTGWHRDTWGSGVASQTNWWTPIFPITAGRTIAFALDHWTRRVRNDSDSWSPPRLASSDDPPPGATTAQVIPEPEEDLAGIAEIPAVMDPGDLLCFSGAQLHRSVPNFTDRIRFSIEIRTLTSAEVRQGRGAPNVDWPDARPRYGWFRHLRTDEAMEADPFSPRA